VQDPGFTGWIYPEYQKRVSNRITTETNPVDCNYGSGEARVVPVDTICHPGTG